MDKYDFLIYERAGVVLLDPIATLMAFLIVVVVGVAVAGTRLPRALKQLIYAALAFRVIGAIARYVVLFAVYAGSGDSRHYYSQGLENAGLLWALNPGPIFDPANWWGNKWWGTQFVYFPSTLVHAVIGASMPGGYIVFSLFAFAGLCGFVLAFRRTYPHVPIARYARWVWFFPALWFWPSSIGKEAIVLLGMGLTMAGYVGRNGRINWLLLASGIFFVFAIRPQVAAVVIASLLLAHWLSLITGRWTMRNTVQAVVLIAAGLAGLYYALKMEGIEVGGGGVVEYMEDSGGRDLEGGSNIEAVPVGVAGIPLALVNILFRPFPWEASSLVVLVTSIEIMAFWAIAWYRRANLLSSLRHWRHDRLLRVAIPFILAYSISLGMVLANMGVIARQRIFLFPFLFILLEAVPARAARARPTGVRARRPGAIPPAVIPASAMGRR